MKNFLIIAIMSLLFLGCTKQEENEASGAIPERHLKALEKAKETEKILLEAEKKRKKDMESRGIR